jgi:phytoene desaturase
MYAIVQAMYDLAVELGVEFKFNEPVRSIKVKNGKATEVVTDLATYMVDAVISGADYEHTERALLAPEHRTYSAPYWKKRVMAPSCLMYYVGLNKKLKNIVHHSLFFDVPFAPHGVEIYKNPSWPKAPLFYVSVSSLTDVNVAPEGQENIVFLIPIASGLEGDTEELREHYFQIIAKRMEQHVGESILDAVVYKKMYSVRDFVTDYNSFQGNAYGLANTLLQTAILRPSCKSKKVKNLFFTGQLTVPGPGVPPSLISGEVVAGEVIKSLI